MRKSFNYLIVLALLLNVYFGNASTSAENKELDFCKNPEMYPGVNLHLGYWDVFRGRGNLLRLVCELSQMNYTEHVFGGYLPDGTFDFANWFGHFKALIKKIDPDSDPNLPFLVDCTDTRKTKFMTETLDLMIYLSRKYNPRLIGEGFSVPESHILKLSAEISELYTQWPVPLIGKQNSIESILNSDEYFTGDELTSGPIVNLFKIENIVRKSVEKYGGPLMFGNEPTLADIFVYEYASIVDSLYSGIISDSPYTRELVDAFSEIPLVAKFFSSDRSVIYPPVINELVPSQHLTSFNPWRTFSSQLEKLGKYLVFYGHSESTSAASICLSYKISSLASSNIGSDVFNDIYGLLQFSQIADAGVRMVGRNALVRFWYRITRRLSSTKNRMRRSCIAIITSGKYHQVSITEEIANEICTSFVNCYNNRGSIWNITKKLIDANNRFKFYGGSTATFNAERYMKKHVTSPMLFGKAIRFYYQSKIMLRSGSLPKNIIVDLLSEIQNKGAISTFGLTLNKNLAVKTCIEYCSNKLPISGSQYFRDSYSLQTLCETVLEPYYLEETPSIEGEKLSSLVSLLEQISN